MAVNHERVIADRKTMLFGDCALSLLDSRIDELLDAPAIETENVIVMRPRIEFEDRHPVSKVMTRDETRGLELRQHPIHRGKPDLFAQVDETAIDILGRKMPLAARLEDLEDLDARQRDLEARLAQVIAFHVNPQPFG